jgi:molybdate transport system ATP-binding protein
MSYRRESIDGLAPWRRPFRYLNQRRCLFPYLTLDGNLALAQYAAGKKRDKEERRRLLAEFEGDKENGTCDPGVP